MPALNVVEFPLTGRTGVEKLTRAAEVAYAIFERHHTNSRDSYAEYLRQMHASGWDEEMACGRALVWVIARDAAADVLLGRG